MRVSKHFWVSDNDFKKIVKHKETSVVLRCKDESNFEGLVEKAIYKITISYEIDREVTIKESDFDKFFPPEVGFFNRDLQIIKQKLFGGGENE